MIDAAFFRNGTADSAQRNAYTTKSAAKPPIAAQASRQNAAGNFLPTIYTSIRAVRFTERL